MGWESFGVVGFDRGPVLQGRTRILHLQYFFKYVLTYSLHLNSYLVTFLHNTICREQLFCPFLLSGSDFLLNMLFNYHLLYFCTALSLVIMLSSHYYLHKSKTLSQLTQCPFTGTLLLLILSFIHFWFLAYYRLGLWYWGTVDGTQTGISKHSFYVLLQNPRKKMTTSSSLSCNPSTGRLDSAFSSTW